MISIFYVSVLEREDPPPSFAIRLMINAILGLVICRIGGTFFSWLISGFTMHYVGTNQRQEPVRTISTLLLRAIFQGFFC